MKSNQEDEPYEKLCIWLGESEDSNWTKYSTELVAKTVLIDFTQKQWEKLEKEVLEKPEFWQQRCVVSLGEDRSDHAVTILKLLLSKSPYKDVKILSAYELDWAEVPIEKKYASFIKKIIDTIPSSEIEPEIYSLLAKAERSKL